jgi:hypothetical protein
VLWAQQVELLSALLLNQTAAQLLADSQVVLLVLTQGVRLA